MSAKHEDGIHWVSICSVWRLARCTNSKWRLLESGIAISRSDIDRVGQFVASPDCSKQEEQEIWQPISCAPNYAVSSLGRVRSKAQRILRPANHRNYLQVGLSLGTRNNKIYRMIHCLVAEAFIDERRDRQVNHVDGNKHNNRLSNLEYVTASENVRHAFATGLSKSFGGGSPKLDESDVKYLRKVFCEGGDLKAAFDLYPNVSAGHLWRVARGTGWLNAWGDE